MILPGGRGLFEVIERTYVDEESRLFIKTGQRRNDYSSPLNEGSDHSMGFAQISGRRAFITLQPFHTLTEQEQEKLRTEALPFNEENSSVTKLTDLRGQRLVFIDTVARTASAIGFSQLDADVQAPLRDAARDEYHTKLERILGR